MKELLPHYERELAFLRAHAGEFARQNPKIAGRLLLGSDVAEDPHVQRLIEAFALLSARVHKRLDDDFPLFTESFLEVLYPHYLRPFPSCSIASFSLAGAGAQLTTRSSIERGSMLNTRPVRGVKCRFRTAYDVALLPVRIGAAAFRASVSAPDGSKIPRDATAAFALELELDSPQATWSSLDVASLRVYLDGEPSQVSALREALCGQVLAVAVQTAPTGPWEVDAEALPRSVGFAADEALIDFDARSHPAYRLLTEYFAFPEKFNFVDIPLPRPLLASRERSVKLHVLLAGLRADSDQARLLETVSERNLLLGCTPIVNLISHKKADPIRVTHASASYPVVPDGRHAFGYEVVAIDRVYRVQQTQQGESIDEFKPFYSLRHDDLLSEGEAAGRYWSIHRDETLAERSPGYEVEISIVDIHANPARPQTDTLSIELTATNRDLPHMLSVGNAGGDLFLDGGSVARDIRMLRRPTPSGRFERGRGALWRLISHLSLNHLSLSAGGIDALREMLRLYDLPRSATNSRLIAGLVQIEYRPASACLAGNPFATFVRGTEIRLSVAEQNFTGSGLRLLAELLSRFFGLYVHANSFTQLKLVSARTGEVLVECQRRSGDSPLL